MFDIITCPPRRLNELEAKRPSPFDYQLETLLEAGESSVLEMLRKLNCVAFRGLAGGL